MSKFYGQVDGASSTTATRRGHDGIKVSAQSYDGSLQTSLWYDENDELMVKVSYCEGSGFYGDELFWGKFSDLIKKFRGEDNE